MLEKNLYQPERQPDYGSVSTVEERKGLVSSFEWTDDVPEGLRTSRFSFYKLILFLHDLLVINFAFGISAFFAGTNFYMHGNWPQAFVLFIFSFFFVSFFHTYDLYDYHNLFLQRTR